MKPARRLAVICARGGSKGVKGKNARPLAGKPLLAHALDHARASGCFDCVAVSSDSPEILEIGRSWGADVLVPRPAQMATDSAPKVPAIRHCMIVAEQTTGATFDLIADLAVTSPLRAPSDIVDALQLLETSPAPNVLTAYETDMSPYFNLVEFVGQDRFQLCKIPDKPFASRQAGPRVFALNGAVFIWRRSALIADDAKVLYENSLLHVMPPERSVDIDSEIDFAFAEFLFQRRAASPAVKS